MGSPDQTPSIPVLAVAAQEEAAAEEEEEEPLLVVDRTSQQ